MLLDIHTHHPLPQPEGVIALRVGVDAPTASALSKSQLYSAGIHPWDTVAEPAAAAWESLRELLAAPEVVAIGEVGVDLTPHGGPMFRQLQVFRRQVELSEEFRKPLVIHNVKGHDMIVGMRRDLKPTQKWAIHGFRGKPQVAEMLLRAGCYLSFGAEFNAETLREVPEDRILAETDTSPLTIEEVIAKLSTTLGRDLTEIIEHNTHKFLSL